MNRIAAHATPTLPQSQRGGRAGSTSVRVVRVEGPKLVVAELDAIDGTPVLDSKPVMQEFLPREPVNSPPGPRS